MNAFQILGFIGTGVVALAYIPQIHHLIKQHCSAGISIRAYVLWFFASLLFLAHATMNRDVVFIVVQVINLVAIFVIVIYARKYETRMCLAHLGPYLRDSERQQ